MTSLRSASRLAQRGFDKSFSNLPLQQLVEMSRAADDILCVVEAAAVRGSHIICDLVGETPFTVGEHYPPDDTYDFATGCGYYYHAHPTGPRITSEGSRDYSEHGHFHLFVNRKAVPRGAKPLLRPSRPIKNWGVCHVAAIVIDPRGVPSRLFTIHQWLSQEWMYPAPVVIDLLDRFAITDSTKLEPVTRFVVAMTVLFRPQMENLLYQRDNVLANAPPLRRPRFGETLDITSEIAIDLDRQIAAVDRALSQTRRGRPACAALLPAP